MAAVLALTSVLTVSAAPVRFGARLTNDTQPQPAQWCDEPNDTPPHANCTWILNEAHQRGDGGIKAPKAGTIGRVRLMSCTPGSFRVQVARKVPGTNRYKVRKNGPQIQYEGDQQGCGDDDDFTYRIESFRDGLHRPAGRPHRHQGQADGNAALRRRWGQHAALRPAPLVGGSAPQDATTTRGCIPPRRVAVQVVS